MMSRKKDLFLSEAFFQCCKETQSTHRVFLSLYVSEPFYGGPEEGGWWGHDDSLVAYQEFPSEEQADEAKDAVETMAVELNEQARYEFGRRCQAECEWLEARGLDADYLPEVDGESHYYVVIEERPGSHEHSGCRHYE